MRTLLAVLLSLIAAPVFAAEESSAPDTVFPQKMTANELMVACAGSSISATGRLRQRYCDGFLSGLEEGLRVVNSISRLESVPVFCVPSDVSSKQIRAIFIRNSATIKRVATS